MLDFPSSLMLSVKNSGDVFLLSNNLLLKKAFILKKKISCNSNITVTKEVKITMKNIIYKSKKINIHD